MTVETATEINGCLYVGNWQASTASLLAVTGDAENCYLQYKDFEIELEGAVAATVWQWREKKGR
jgi:hypothetical protein